MVKKEMVRRVRQAHRRLTHHQIATGTARLRAARGQVHKLPADLRKALTSAPAARAAWEDITPLARNEFICWVISAKKPETRSRRIKRTREELTEGKRRPCCWAGCPHR